MNELQSKWQTKELAQTPSGSALFDSFFVDHLLRFHRDTTPSKTRHEIEENYYQRPDKKENILAHVDTQCQWLRDIGFQDVDCFFKVFELALFGGRKASKKPMQPIAGDPALADFIVRWTR